MPEEDQETQQALMERVLEILLAVENLTNNEKAQVQDSLTFLRSDITGTPVHLSPRQMGYANLLFNDTRLLLFIDDLDLRTLAPLQT
jgi:hypothetical protein